MSRNILIGQHPLIAKISQGSRWLGKDGFPSNERPVEWLEYINSKGQFDRFLSRLKDSPDKRDECLAEIKAAYFIEKHAGYPVTAWEPPGNKGTLGEFSFTFGGRETFCEVKSPGWEREIVERKGPNSPRLKLPKYLPGVCGESFGNWDYVRYTIDKAYPKFPIDKPTLLLLVDDFIVSLTDDSIGMRRALYEPGLGCFAINQYCNIGAVAVLDMEKSDPTWCLYHNPNALTSVVVPKEVFRDYQQDFGGWRQ